MKKFLTIFSVLAMPFAASAHGIGEIYALPVPLKYYLIGAALAVAFSFIVLGIFFKKKAINEKGMQTSIPIRKLPHILRMFRYVMLFLFALLIFTGSVGSDVITENFAPVFFWIYFLLGVSIASLIIGNIWDKINPFRFITSRLFASAQRNNKSSGWIGIVLLFGLFWLELVSGYSFDPWTLATVFFLYVLINFAGAYYYSDWYERGELFSVMFGFIGRLAHWRISDDELALVKVNEKKKLNGAPAHWTHLGVASILLAGATFDNLKETNEWYSFIQRLGFPFTNLRIPNTLGLLGIALAFCLTYLIAVWIMKQLVQSPEKLSILSQRFVYSLIPIAFGYILAHNFTLLIVTGPVMLAVISDPFGFGWNIFGTADFRQTTLLLGAKFVWLTEIGFILLAHIVGVIYAHILALNIFEVEKKAVKSQYPMVILMVCYTLFTLWVISQPLVVGK